MFPSLHDVVVAGLAAAATAPLSSVYLCPIAFACVSWPLLLGCAPNVCLSASGKSVYVALYPRHGPGPTQALDESPLLTVPSNAPYITYTDTDGQVYRREEEHDFAS